MMLEKLEKYTLFVKEDSPKEIIKKLKQNLFFLKEVKICILPDSIKVKLTDILGKSKTYNLEIMLIEYGYYIVELEAINGKIRSDI